MAMDVPRLYALADADRDGKISGAEAVRFLQKSGLSNEVLGQIWDLASAGQPVLLLPQFAAAMRLVSLAQLAGGRLPPGDQARAAAAGHGPPLPPPRLAGVDTGAPVAPAAAGQGVASYAPQLTGVSSVGAPPHAYMPQMTGASSALPPTPVGGGGGGGGAPPPPAFFAPPGAATGGYAPQVTGGAAAYGYIPQATGGSMMAGPTGGSVPGAAPLPPGLLPPASPADAARYADVFRQIDADRDGLVKGAEAFGPLVRTGVERGVLKRVWDSVAGPSAGALTAAQFAAAMYLAEAARAIGPAAAAQLFSVPRLMPPGPFPPVVPGAPPLEAGAAVAVGAGATGATVVGAGAGGPTGASSSFAPPTAAASPRAPQQQQQQQPVWTLASQFGGAPASKVVADAYDNPAPKFPKAPGKAAWDPKLQQVVVDGKTVVTPGGSGEGESSSVVVATAAAAAARAPVPDADAALKAALPAADRERLEAARGEAAAKDRALREAEADAAAQRRRGEAFAQVLGELALFRSRTDVALLQAKGETERLRREADEFERRYAQQEAEVEERRRAGDEAHARVRAALAAREEAATRLRLLREELEMVARLNPQEVAALEREVSDLASRAAAAEAEKAAAALALESGRAQRALLAGRVDDLKMAAAAAEAELGRTRAEVEEVARRAEAALAAAAKAAGGGEGGGEGEGGGGGGAEIAALLSRAAAAYRSLHSAAAAHGVEVPYEASVSSVGGLVWLEQLMAGTADWAEWDGESSGAGGGGSAAGGVSASMLPATVGYALVNTLPDLEGVPPALLRPTAEIFVVRQQPQPQPQQGSKAGEEGEEDKVAAAAGGRADGDGKGAAAAAAGEAMEEDKAAKPAESTLSPAHSGGGPAMRPRGVSSEGAPGAAAAAAVGGGAAVAATAATAAAGGEADPDDAKGPQPSASELTAATAAPAPMTDDAEAEDAVTPLAGASGGAGAAGGLLAPLPQLRTEDDSDVLSDHGGNHHHPAAAAVVPQQQVPAFVRSLTTQSSGFEAANAFSSGDAGDGGGAAVGPAAAAVAAAAAAGAAGAAGAGGAAAAPDDEL